MQTKKKEWKNDDEIYYLLLCKLISFCIFVRRFWWYWYLQKLQEMKWIEIYWTCKLLSSLSNMLIPFLKYYLLDSNNWACYKYFQFIDYSNTNFSVESKMPIFFCWNYHYVKCRQFPSAIPTIDTKISALGGAVS